MQILMNVKVSISGNLNVAIGQLERSKFELEKIAYSNGEKVELML